MADNYSTRQPFSNVARGDAENMTRAQLCSHGILDNEILEDR